MSGPTFRQWSCGVGMTQLHEGGGGVLFLFYLGIQGLRRGDNQLTSNSVGFTPGCKFQPQKISSVRAYHEHILSSRKLLRTRWRSKLKKKCHRERLALQIELYAAKRLLLKGCSMPVFLLSRAMAVLTALGVPIQSLFLYSLLRQPVGQRVDSVQILSPPQSLKIFFVSVGQFFQSRLLGL